MEYQDAITCETTVARMLAAEDLRCGDFVGILSSLVELPSFLWSRDPDVAPPTDPVRMRYRPTDGGVPLKVKAICLPFVLVKSPIGEHRTLDVRQCELVRLHTTYAQAAWKSLRKKLR